MKYHFCDTCSIKLNCKFAGKFILTCSLEQKVIDEQSQIRTRRFCLGFVALHVQNTSERPDLRMRLIVPPPDSRYWLSQCCYRCLSNKQVGGTEMTHFTFIKVPVDQVAQSASSQRGRGHYCHGNRLYHRCLPVKFGGAVGI